MTEVGGKKVQEGKTDIVLAESSFNEKLSEKSAHGIPEKTKRPLRSDKYDTMERNMRLLTKVFGSIGRLRVLKTLVEEGEQMLSDIADRSHTSHESARKHLNFFKKLNIVKEKTFGRFTVFHLVENSERLTQIKRTLQSWSISL